MNSKNTTLTKEKNMPKQAATKQASDEPGVASSQKFWEYAKKPFKNMYLWIDSESVEHLGNSTKVNWFRTIPFILVHGVCLFAFLVGFSWFALVFGICFYLIRMFAITGIYHRYFSHRTYKLNRFWQFMFALLGASCAQRGALWWAANHRHHHRYSDTEKDIHSPGLHGFLWSHMGWFTCDISFQTPKEYIQDFAKYPELQFLNRFDGLVPTLSGFGVFFLGMFLEIYFPALGVTRWQLLVWGFFISTVFLFHATVSINSLTHMFGKKRFVTGDESRNNWFLSIFTLGEGWHNNHHYYPAAAKQGFYWWEIDVTYYVLKGLSFIGIVKGLRAVPNFVYQEAETHEAVIRSGKDQSHLLKARKKY